jgi:hypothetical protein
LPLAVGGAGARRVENKGQVNHQLHVSFADEVLEHVGGVGLREVELAELNLGMVDAGPEKVNPDQGVLAEQRRNVLAQVAGEAGDEDGRPRG